MESKERGYFLPVGRAVVVQRGGNMFIALDEYNRIRCADETAPGKKYYCPVCGEPLSVRRGEVRHPYFAHFPGKTCSDSWDGEYDGSDWHGNWQEKFPLCNQEVVVQLGAIKHRADILTGKTVLEFQHSPLTADAFNKRNNFYLEFGYKVVWLFDLTADYAEGKVFEADEIRFCWKWPRNTFREFDVEQGKVEVFFQIKDEDKEDCIVKVKRSLEDKFASFEISGMYGKDQFLAYFKCINGNCPQPFLTDKQANPEYLAFKEKYGIRLDNQQERAVETADGPVLVLAVPGSGKTTTLISRIAYLVNQKKISGNNILALTFTTNSAKDMKDRYEKQFGKDDAVRFQTIHAFSYSIVNQYIGKKSIDTKLQHQVIREIYRKKYPYDACTTNDIQAALSVITHMKNMMLTDEDITEQDVWGYTAKQFYEEYQAGLQRFGVIDFDDLLLLAYKLLKSNAVILDSIQEQYRYICVDEAQDTSKLQYEIIRLIASKYNNVFMVGDEDQSIYRFRGAYPQGLLNFKDAYPNPFILKLETNYRSTEEIVDAAKVFISRNKNRYVKDMKSARGAGHMPEPIYIVHREDQYTDAVERITRNAGRQIAILFRENACIVPLADLLIKNNIEFGIGKSKDLLFFHEHVVNDIRDFLALASNPMNTDAFKGIYGKCGAYIRSKDIKGICGKVWYGKKNIYQALQEWYAFCHKEYMADRFREKIEPMTKMKPDEAIVHIFNNGYGEYLKEKGYGTGHIELLVTLARDDKSIPDFFKHLDDLEKKLNSLEDGNKSVVLSTVHSSKGLEYDWVYLMDVFDGLFPAISSKASAEEQAEQYQEERRLFYVAMTRAKNHLYIYRPLDRDCLLADEVFPMVPNGDRLSFLLKGYVDENVFVGNSMTKRAYCIKMSDGYVESAREIDVDTGEMFETDKLELVERLAEYDLWSLI